MRRNLGLPRSRTARSPPTDTVRLETQVVEENVHGVIVQGIECFAHGGPPRHPHRAHSFTKTTSSPVTAVDTVPRRGLWLVGLNETRANLAN